ncbi:uncharacterized protein LOC142172167 [Nicotiana tabacum]|uniref:Uncharacterized protein LOC142172167 n=1 Tax=Nicotiana tabacum TaxID=4097 RepID=A0AC58T494_TOBAC
MPESVDQQKWLDRWSRLLPPNFGGKRSEDPHDFIDRWKDRLRNMGILESNGVDFTTFQPEDKAHIWWQAYLLSRLTGSPPLTWDKFTHLFLEKYIPPSERQELPGQFERLCEGHMFVTDYEARFTNLSRHASIILPIDA